MRSLFTSVVALMCSFCFLPCLGAEIGKKPVDHQQHSAGGFWRVDNGFDSYLRLTNILQTAPLIVVPELYLPDGTVITLQSVPITQSGVAAINVSAAVRDLKNQGKVNPNVMFGSAGLRYDWAWPAVSGSIQNLNEAAHISYISSLVSTETTALNPVRPAVHSRTITGLWWITGAAGDATLALSNTRSREIARNATFRIFDQSGSLLSRTEFVVPHHSSVIVKLRDILGASLKQDDRGYYEITYNGLPQEVVVAEEISDPESGYSAGPPASEFENSPNPVKTAVTWVAGGLMSGTPQTKMQFPQATVFTPYLYMVNRGDAPLTVTLAVSESGAKSGTLRKETLILAPHVTTYESLLSKDNPKSEYVDLKINYSGNPESLLLAAGSRDQTDDYVFEVTPSMVGPTLGKIFCYWTIQADTSTMFSIWNTGVKTDTYNLTLNYPGGHYILPLSLAAGESTVIDLHSLFASNAPDSEGTVLPTYIKEGSASLTSSEGEQSVINVSTSAAMYNVRNATCTPTCITCNGVVSFVLTPQAPTLNAGGAVTLTGVETYNTGSTTLVHSGTWTSSNTSVATVNTTGTVTAANEGSGQAKVTLGVPNTPTYVAQLCDTGTPRCPSVPLSAVISVNVSAVPTSMSVYMDPGNRQNNNCQPTYQNSRIRNIQYQLMVGSSPAQSSYIQEDFSGSNPQSTCGNGPATPTSCETYTVSGAGVFTDTISTNYCSTSSNNGCGVVLAPDHWQTCANGNVKTISSPTYVIQWKDVTINGSEMLQAGTPVP